jgi:mono/diheme cytochrome c family protein
MRRFVTALLSVLIFVVASGISPVFAAKTEENRATREKGRIIYDRSCIFCHGVDGRGDGPAGWFIGRFSSPHPRDFTKESYKLRSTASGEMPTDQDLFRTVTQGIPGYMPSFNGLSEEERWHVIAYVKSFNPIFKAGNPTPMSFPDPPFPSSEASIENGRKLYVKYSCHTCHGDNGYGDGPESIKGNLKDARGLPISSGNLSDRASLKNGSSPRDIYRSVMTGLDGTPMPSYADSLSGKEKEVWDLVYYVLSLSSEWGFLRW